MGKFSIQSNLENLNENEVSTIKDRIEGVAYWQRKNEMEPRDDSILTWRHATGFQTGISDIAIAKELVAVNYIFKNTWYSRLIEDSMRLMASHLVENYALNWKISWYIVRKYVPDMLKLYCMHKQNIRIPQFITH